jgi:tRNA (guanine-N7-)-methyltransferase
MSWENQYMQLVTTKPGVIIAERDREFSNENLCLVRKRLTKFSDCLVELGSGSGGHLLSLARQSPHALCIGLEIRFKRAFRTGEKAESLGLTNVMVLRTDARQISALFKEGEVTGFFINYPDPWDKRRWLKNRLINDELLRTMHRLLKPTGFFRYKTDHHEYFSSVKAALSSTSWEVRRETSDLVQSPYYAKGNIPTEFEQLWKSRGKALCMLEAVKRT